MLQKLPEREAVEHSAGGNAALARHFDTPMGHVDFTDRMRIRVDAHGAAKLERALMPTPVEVEPPGIAVDFHCNPVPGTGGKNLFDVDVITGRVAVAHGPHK